MTTFFAICALIGGTVLICQALLTVLGLGADADFHDVTDIDADVDVSGADQTDVSSEISNGHASTALFKILTFRTLVAASTFFGLAGLAADAAGMNVLQALAIALCAGMVATYGIHELMRLLNELRSDGTVRLQDAIDREAQVYLRIPAERAGRGKVHVVLNGQTVELQAETGGEAIPGGCTVRVTDYLGADVVSVMPLHTKPVDKSAEVAAVG